MTATVEHILREIKALPPADIREVWEEISPGVNDAVSPQTADTKAALEATHSLYGRFAGGKSLVRLLQDRARDRAREDDKLHRLTGKYA